MNRKSFVLVSVLAGAVMVSALLASGCGSSKQESDKDPEPSWVQTALYFGGSIPSGGDVSDADFQQFLQEVVTPGFPAGLTVFDSYGQMQDEGDPITRQDTRVVLLVHEKNEESAAAVKRVIEAYRGRFGSPQVMHTTQPVEPEFFPAGGE